MNGTWGPIISDFHVRGRSTDDRPSSSRNEHGRDQAGAAKSKARSPTATARDGKLVKDKSKHAQSPEKPPKQKEGKGKQLLAKKRLKGIVDNTNGDPSLEISGHRALRIRNRIKTRLTNARYFQTMLDAYEQDGWGPSSHRKLKPTEELKKSSESLVHAKKEIKELLKQMDPASNELAQNECPKTRIDEHEYEQDGLAFEKVFRGTNLLRL
eukprot:761369-Hanusia_phi.AAC.8